MADTSGYNIGGNLVFSTIDPFDFLGVIAPYTAIVDTIPPSIHTILPAPPGPLLSAQAISFLLTDNSGEFGIRELWIRFGDVDTYDFVHDGTVFRGLYADSSIAVILGGFSFSLVRAGGWPKGARVRLRASVVDRWGNVVVVSA